MKIRNHYIANFLIWIYLYFPLEKWFDMKYHIDEDVYLELKFSKDTK